MFVMRDWVELRSSIILQPLISWEVFFFCFVYIYTKQYKIF